MRLGRWGDATTENRFEAKFTRGPDCWEWTGGRSSDGYGSFSIAGKHIGAHRFAWIYANGSIPDGAHVLHRCDNPPCVNPEHLFLGTHFDNMRDCGAKGRRSHIRGEKHGASRVTFREVTAIRYAYALAGCQQVDLARAVGISQQLVSNIVNGKSWVRF
jgi:hypothetical protein